MPSSCFCAARNPRKKDLSAGSKKRRFAGKLRKLCWIIYQRMKFKKKKLRRIFKYYKKQVDWFLIQFSSFLKTFEVVIWKQKVMTTGNDVSKYLNEVKKATAIAIYCQWKLNSGNGSRSPKGDLGLLGDLFQKTGLLLVSFSSKSLLFQKKLRNHGTFQGFCQNNIKKLKGLRFRQWYELKTVYFEAPKCSISNVYFVC